MSAGEVARRAIEICLELGVREFCVCPGSRNAPLLAALEGGGKSYRFFEERGAGFFAVGRAMATRQPVAVVVTSGTAVAELLPAVIEAHYQGLPLVVVSADRPEAFRGSGAPQAIEQVGIFGEYMESCVEIDEGALEGLPEWSGRRSLHLNVCLDEPGAGDLEGAGSGVTPGSFIRAAGDGSSCEVESFLGGEGDLLVLVGQLAVESVPGARDFLRKLGAPIYAEATSGLRADEALNDLLLRGPERVFGSHPWKRVLRVGGVPSLRFWRDMETRTEVTVCSVCPEGFSGLGRRSTLVVADPGAAMSGLNAGGPSALPGEVMERDREAGAKLAELLERYPRSEAALLGDVSNWVPEEAPVFLGNSLPVREWNLAAGPGGKCFANRGANGIDGQLSSFLGCAAQSAEGWGIFGDLTALYDLGAPWVLSQMKGRMRFVVVNNGGGGIFSRLPSLAGAGAGVREMIEMPHGVGFASWARMWGMEYLAMRGPGELLLGDEGHSVIEVLPDAEESAAFWRELEKL